MDLELKNKTALVLASTRGLGYGCAKILSSEGVKVVINGRNNDIGVESAGVLGNGVQFIKADLSNSKERNQLFIKTREILGDINILVLNGDSPESGTFINKSIEDWQQAIEQVMFPAIDLIKKCITTMEKNKFGRIINISSISAKEISKDLALTSGLKPGLIGVLSSLAREVAPYGITINSILPGPFNTDLLKKYLYQNKNIKNSKDLELYKNNIPVNRLGTIEEFGSLCTFLCSPLAGYITGQSIAIDGGKFNSIF